jgi:hypothetical protein
MLVARPIYRADSDQGRKPRGLAAGRIPQTPQKSGTLRQPALGSRWLRHQGMSIGPMPLSIPPTTHPRKAKTRVRVLTIVAVATAGCSVLLHALSAGVYYRVMSERLMMIDEMAVRRGAEYLAQGPQKAIREVQTFALDHGIAQDEISFIRTAESDHSIGMALKRKVPRYVATFSVGLPNRIIRVTAWAQMQRTQPPPGAPLLVADR